MRKNVEILLLFVSLFGFSRSEIDNYEIYSLVIKDRVDAWANNNFHKVILKSNYETKMKDIDLLSEFAADSLQDYQENMIEIYASSKELSNNLIENYNLRKLIAELKLDFKFHPKIKPEQLSIGNIDLAIMSNEQYNRFFGKKFERIDKGWKKLKKKFGTQLFIELSKIKYKGNYSVLYYGQHCGELCGFGRLIILEKNNGKWEILGDLVLWNV